MGIRLNSKGFTLIEIAVVVFLIGLLLFLSVPSVRDALLRDHLQATVNRITATAANLRNDAVRENVARILNINIDERLFWTYSVDMTPEKKADMKRAAFVFPESVNIIDVSYATEEKKTEGEMAIVFYKNGMVQPAVIHLADGDRQVTLIFEPFLNKIRIYDKYVDYPALNESARRP